MTTRNLIGVFFSDPHIGRAWGAHTVPSARAKLTARYLDPVKELKEKYPLTPLVCGGDWFDRAHNDEATIGNSYDLLMSMAAVLAGNHDHVNRAEAVTSLNLQHTMAGPVSSPVVLNDAHLNEGLYNIIPLGSIVTLYAVPHHGTQALFEQALMAADDKANKTNEPKILLVHCNFGAPGEGKPDSNLYLTPQLRTVLEETFDLIMVGHEHLHRRIGNTIVMGSSQPCNFGELGPRFYYEVYEADGGLQVEMIQYETQLTHVVYDLSGGVPEALEAKELVDLKGVVPIAKARDVQKLVKSLFAEGALAVRLGVAFDKGVTIDGDAVTSSMSNLVQVVRGELAENAPWRGLFEDALAELGEDS